MGAVRALARLAPGPVWPGMRVGLYGGSFDPPHEGHAHVAKAALTQFGLDQVWVLVSPQNPLKSGAPAPYAQRLDAARRVLAAPRIFVSDIEARLGARYTVETLTALRRRYPGVRFVLVMGADSFASLHRWKRWRDIVALAPIGVAPRPGWSMAALNSPAARAIPRMDEKSLSGTPPPGWSYASAPFNIASSTALRGR